MVKFYSQTFDQGGILLTPSDVADLTGYKRGAEQRRFLQDNRIPFIVDRRGLPKVLRSVLEHDIGLREQTPRAHEPDLDALKELQHGKKEKI